MPLGIERLNVRKRPPNAHITFITALPGQDHEVARDYLERLAAMVYPVMRDNGLAVMSLDEFPANKEFWGRNFNAGEVIQIVLKNPNSGAWLPFRFVQGVMVHELAHIKQMNHSRSFWAVNNKFSTELGKLRERGYTGEGFWSAGRTLISEEYTRDQPVAENDMPRTLCGGTYRSRNKRKNPQDGENIKKPKLTYAERQQRRKERKFGHSEGDKVGADDDARIALENGKKNRAAPRVAQSARGRELRAAAALERLKAQKVETAKGGSSNDGDEDEEGGEEEEWGDDEKKVDVGGGKYLVPVSQQDDGDFERDWLKRELLDLKDACGHGTSAECVDEKPDEGKGGTLDGSSGERPYREEIDLISDDDSPEYVVKDPSTQKATRDAFVTTDRQGPSAPKLEGVEEQKASPHISEALEISCTACSVTNESSAILCAVCANVLNPKGMKSAWKCPCYGDLLYMNPGDAGVCGICGRKRGVRGRGL